MDKKPPRVAYSFQSGTFDLRGWCPGLWQEGDDGRSMLVWLDTRWEEMFAVLNRVGGLLVSVRSGPMQVVTWMQKVDFSQVPGSHELVDLSSGMLVRRNALGSAMVVVEERDGQQMASVQFYTRKGEGCLKILLTQESDCRAFKALVLAHARASIWRAKAEGERLGATLAKSGMKGVVAKVNGEQVRCLWRGMWRSQAGRHFPGLSMVPRLDAIRAAGVGLAWELPVGVERTLLVRMMETSTEMEFAVRNRVVSMSAQGVLVRSNRCGCGETFFGWQTQVTLRCCCGEWTAWVLRGEGYRVEMFDEGGEFSGSFAVADGVREELKAVWQNELEQCRP